MIGSRQIAFAAFAALVIEFGVLLVVASWSVSNPAQAAVVAPDPGEIEIATEEETSVTLVPVVPVEVAEAPAAPPREVLQFIETTDDQPPAQPTRPTNLISANSTQAAGGEGPDQPDKRPQPEVKGRDIPGLEVANQDFQEGADDSMEQGAMPGPPAPAAPPVVAAPPAKPPEPAPPPEVATAADKPKADTPTPAERSLESIKPMIEMPDSLPRLSVGGASEKLPPRREETPARDLAPRPPPGGGGGADPGFRSQKISRAMEGTISRRGPAALDVEATPLGRYLQMVVRIVTRDWQRACRRNENMMHVQPGFIRVNFLVAPDGKVLRASAIEQRDAGETQKLFTVNAVRQAALPPIPKEVVEILENGKLEVNFNFLFL